MIKSFSLGDFLKQFPSEEACLEEIKKLRFPKGILCPVCSQTTKHYKVNDRLAYSCEYCRHQVYPLVGTIFEKSSTSLRLWFFCMYLMVQTKATISIRQMQHELGVTYKTAWRMYREIYTLMEHNNGDLLAESKEVIAWTLFNTFEFKVVQKQDDSG